MLLPTTLLLFSATVTLVIFIVAFLLWKYANRFWLFGWIGWVVVVGLLGYNDFFTVFDTLPPRIAFIILPMIACSVWLAVSTTARKVAEKLPLKILLGVQVFRVAVEIFLYQAYEQGKLPIEMTFAGRNFDILVGLTAPLIAVLSIKKIPKNLLIIWNYWGMLILSIVVLHGIGAAPTVIQFFHLNPSNEIIGHFPYVYLPAVLVFTAYAFHILAIRHIKHRNQ
jgi:hypothetical protein